LKIDEADLAVKKNFGVGSVGPEWIPIVEAVEFDF